MQNKVKRAIKGVGLYVWQLPQNLIGLSLRLFYKPRLIRVYGDCLVYICPTFPGGISLGRYVYLGGDNKVDILHELGHCKCSKKLGLFYLLIVGLPSIVHAWLHSYFPGCKGKSYYHFYTELWADAESGIVR